MRALLLGTLLLVACSESSKLEGAPGGGEAGAAGAPAECNVPSAAEIASTPRADTNLELLALRLSPGIVAEPAIYERVLRDVAAIREAEPSLADIGYYPTDHDGRSLFLAIELETFPQFQSGQYHDWDCLNEAYVVTDKQLNDAQFTPSVTLELKGIYDLKQVALEYAELPGITGATPNVTGGDGPTLCITREEDGVWQWVVDQASGDCLSGCTEHRYFHFTVDEDGSLVSHGELYPDLVPTYASSAACR